LSEFIGQEPIRSYGVQLLLSKGIDQELAEAWIDAQAEKNMKKLPKKHDETKKEEVE
jgi:hypothetical protein